jgi:hypothetical protein
MNTDERRLKTSRIAGRNPQKFMDIPRALTADFVKATQRVFIGAEGSRIQLLVAE